MTAHSFAVGTVYGIYREMEQSPDCKWPPCALVVFMAFAVEGYLNSLGARKVSFWDEIEERCSWRAKANILHSVAGCKPSWGTEPLQFAAELFKARDRLAHGKPERVLGPVFPTPELAMRSTLDSDLQPDWFARLNRDWLLSAKDKFRSLMLYFGGLFDLPSSDHLMSAVGGIESTDAPEKPA